MQLDKLRLTQRNYFLPLACFAGSETCFFSFRFWSFSRCSFLCCSRPSDFFAFLDKIYQPLAGNRKQRRSKTLPLPCNLTHNAVLTFNYKNSLYETGKDEKTPTVEIRCPKCGSPAVEKNKNQEFRCSHCGEIFYFVTPKCGSPDFERYKL